MKEIKVDNLVTLHQGVIPNEGKPIYDQIKEALNKKEEVSLDFAAIQLMTTAFLNVAIGNLYKDYSSDFIKQYLKLQNVSVENARRIKKVTDTAKLFYKDTALFEKNIKPILDGDIK